MAELHHRTYVRQGCLNRELTVDQILDLKQLTDHARKRFERASEQLNLSMRSQQRMLRLALTISDWDDTEDMTPEIISEALSYRAYDLLQSKNNV